jgi:plasmid maintenance system antidote protein VapI
VPDTRYRLHDGPLLRWLMGHPATTGTPFTVRSLAAATGLSYSKIQKLCSGERPTVSAPEADQVAAAIGFSRRALFSPLSSPFEDGDKRTETTDGPR